jgi:hypothetical protein
MFLSATVHFWALFEHFLAIFASTFLGFYQRNRERPNRSSLVASDDNNKVKVGQGFIESDWLLDFLYKFITK